MRPRNSSTTTGTLLILLSLFIFLPLNRAISQDQSTYKPTGDEASLIGVISFAGVPHAPRRFDTSADPVCETINSEVAMEDVLVTANSPMYLFTLEREIR